VLAGGSKGDKRLTPQGFLIAFRKSMILRIGGYQEYYNPLADERELCLRAWLHGYRSVIAEGCSWQHVHDISNYPSQPIPYLGRVINPRERQLLVEAENEKRISEYNARLAMPGVAPK
jgi:GT2 family glycosyltransferase